MIDEIKNRLRNYLSKRAEIQNTYRAYSNFYTPQESNAIKTWLESVSVRFIGWVAEQLGISTSELSAWPALFGVGIISATVYYTVDRVMTTRELEINKIFNLAMAGKDRGVRALAGSGFAAGTAGAGIGALAVGGLVLWFLLKR